MYRKEIAYDRETRDYAMYLDGELVGFARTYHAAEITLDQLVFELLSDGHFATAAELDGGASDEDPVNWTDRDPEAHAITSEPPPPTPPGQDEYPGIDYDEEGRCRACGSTGHHIQKCRAIRVLLDLDDSLMLMPEGDVLDTSGLRVRVYA